MPGRLVRKATYVKEYHELTKKDGIPFVPVCRLERSVFFGIHIACCRGLRCSPRAFWTVWAARSHNHSDGAASGFLFLVVIRGALALAARDGNPRDCSSVQLSESARCCSFRLFPAKVKKAGSAGLSQCSQFCLVAVSLGTFTHLAGYTPWSPVMDAWSSMPIPQQYLIHRTALERQGALVFQEKQCHNCHSLAGDGGKRGPALDSVSLAVDPRSADPPSDSRRR